MNTKKPFTVPTASAILRQIRAMKEGTATAIVLHDAAEWNGCNSQEGSIRLYVERCYDDKQVMCLLEVQTYTTDETWTATYPTTGTGPDWLSRIYDEDHLPAAIAFYLYVSDFEGRQGFREKPVQRATQSPEAFFIRDLKAVLALEVGDTYRVERESWGPILIPDTCLIEGKRYPVRTTSVLVHRASDTEFIFTPNMKSGNAEGWESCDYGDGTQGNNPHQLWTVNNSVLVEAALRQAVTTADRDALERRDSSDGERQQFGITDEHLRTETLSEATKAAVARGEWS